MNIKLTCYFLLFASLSAISIAADVAFKLKLVVDDGESEKEIKENIEKVVKVNGQIGESVEKLKLRANIESVTPIQNCGEPTPVEAGSNLYRVNVEPQQDSVDNYMANLTGCKYGALKARRSLDLSASGQTFDAGSVFKAVFYLRAPEYVQVHAWWSRFNHEDYVITVKDYGYEAKVLEPHGLRTLLMKSAPGALSPDYYEKYYVTIDNEFLTFGRQCDKLPILVQPVNIRKGDSINFNFRTNSYYGAKFLYDCPLNEVVLQHTYWKPLDAEPKPAEA